MTYEEYIDSELTYEDGFLLDRENEVVMSIHEEPIMKLVAEIITKNGGDILNVGFGMGIVDHFIQLKNPKSHTIIEPHKQIYNKAISEGWNDGTTTMINSCWTDAVEQFIREGKKFDGIYFDTMNYDKYNASRSKFMKKVKYILKENGVCSYFLNLIPTHEKEAVNYFAGEEIFNVNFINIEINNDEERIKKDNNTFPNYFIDRNHVIPIMRLKKTN